jgi:uncharacterized integral membrane protein
MIKDKKLIKIIIISVLAVIMIIVVIQNVTPIKIHFLFWTFTMSRYLVLFLLFTIGFITGWLLRSQSLLRKHGGNES